MSEERRQHCLKLTDPHWTKVTAMAKENNMAVYEIIELMIDKITKINRATTIEVKEK